MARCSDDTPQKGRPVRSSRKRIGNRSVDRVPQVVLNMLLHQMALFTRDLL